jgi:hypothetical protein
MDRLIYTLDEVAEMTGKSAERIRRACKKGRYRHQRDGRSYGMTREQIDAMIAADEVAPTVQPVSQHDAKAAGVEAARQANIARLVRRGAA